VNIDLIDRTAAKGQAREEVIDCLLVAAKQEAGKSVFGKLVWPTSAFCFGPPLGR
jgi:hypothetical protein